MKDPALLYDEDFIAWTKTQAAALRAAARRSTNQALDWEHLAEEVEDLGKSVRHALSSQLRRILRHLIKLEHSPSLDPRRGWKESIRGARMEFGARVWKLQSCCARTSASGPNWPASRPRRCPTPSHWRAPTSTITGNSMRRPRPGSAKAAIA